MSVAVLADIGGTNARFAVRDGTRRTATLRLPTADYPDLARALARVLDDLDVESVDDVAVCAAGPPLEGAIALTNCPWTVSVDALRAATGVASPLLVNDFTALAAALATLAPGEVDAVGGGQAVARAPRAVLGPGTGLGVSAHLPDEGFGVLLSGEGGHVDLPAANGEEDRILARLRERFGHVSAERVLSGAGIVHLHEAMHGRQPPGMILQPEHLATGAARHDPRARATLTQFCAFLGAVAGNLALTLGARGGVYLGGGIVPAWGTAFDRAAFRSRFEDKGRHAGYLRRIPTWIITASDPALAGLERMLRARDAGA